MAAPKSVNLGPVELRSQTQNPNRADPADARSWSSPRPPLQSDCDLGLSLLQQQRFPEKPRRFGVRFVQADADIAEKIGLVSEIRAQLCPETGSLPPRGRQAEDRTEAQMIVA